MENGVTRILAMANQKGGVGKTTTAVNVAAAFVRFRRPILLIDLDPQGNATSSLGVDKLQLKRSTYDVLIDGLPLDACVQSDIRPGLDLLGANNTLAGAEVELVDARERERRLGKAIAASQRDYAAVIIDCPPSLGLLTVNALTAASGVVIPIQCEYLALEGLMQLVNTIDLVKRRLNPSLDVLGVVMTMYDARTRLSAQVLDEVKRYFPSRLFRSIIPRTVRLAEAPSFGQPIYEYSPSSVAASSYEKLTAEIAERVGLADGADIVGPVLAGIEAAE